MEVMKWFGFTLGNSSVSRAKMAKITHHDGVDGGNDAPQKDEAHHRQPRDGVQGQAGGVQHHAHVENDANDVGETSQQTD